MMRPCRIDVEYFFAAIRSLCDTAEFLYDRRVTAVLPATDTYRHASFFYTLSFKKTFITPATSQTIANEHPTFTTMQLSTTGTRVLVVM